MSALWILAYIVCFIAAGIASWHALRDDDKEFEDEGIISSRLILALILAIIGPITLVIMAIAKIVDGIELMLSPRGID